MSNRTFVLTFCTIAFISSLLMSAITRFLIKSRLFFKKVRRVSSRLAFDDFREEERLDHGINTTFFAGNKIPSYLKLFYKSNRLLVLMVYRRDIPRWMLGNNRKACKSLAFGSWFTRFSRVLPTSLVGCHATKPIESVIYYQKVTRKQMTFFFHKMMRWENVKGP